MQAIVTDTQVVEVMEKSRTIAGAIGLIDESSMPAYGGVPTDSEIVSALSWIKAQWPVSIRAKHDEMNRSSPQQR